MRVDPDEAPRAAPRASGTRRAARGAVIRPLAPAVLVGLVGLGCGDRDVPRRFAPATGSARGDVEIHVPERLSSIETDEVDALGRPVRIACATCHSLKATATVPTRPADVEEVHVGLAFDHGEVSCASCHAAKAGEAPLLHLADGTPLPTTEAMRLCGQCHGPQLRDYEAGAHGGMDGHWDLTRGGRTRNHCVDCHDPHVPAPPAVSPAPRARDRVPVPRTAEGHR